MGVVQNYGSPKLPLLYAALSRPFRAPAESRIGNYYNMSVCIFRINSGIQTFREPFAALSRPFATAAKTHAHICRCHMDFRTTPICNHPGVDRIWNLDKYGTSVHPIQDSWFCIQSKEPKKTTHPIGQARLFGAK